jgi:hypothetical protein
MTNTSTFKEPPNKARTDPTRPSDCYAIPKYDTETWKRI